jgi:hypothetical protein
VPTLRLCVLYGSQNKQQLLLYKTLRDWFLWPKWRVFTARYALSPYIKQIRFVFTGLIEAECGEPIVPSKRQKKLTHQHTVTSRRTWTLNSAVETSNAEQTDKVLCLQNLILSIIYRNSRLKGNTTQITVGFLCPDVVLSCQWPQGTRERCWSHISGRCCGQQVCFKRW